MIRVGVIEEPRKMIVRFESDFNPEIRDKVELLPYNDLKELGQLCLTIEQQYAQY